MTNCRLLVKCILILLLLLNCKFAFGNNRDSTITVIIKLKDPVDNFSVKLAPLKYNKDFAFSFTLDDGLISAYLVAFPYFNGGRLSDKYIDQWGYDQGADGKNYPGLFFTDGCGNAIPFKAGIAINAKNVENTDTIPKPGYLSWQQIIRMYHAGWDILNHSYTHATGKNVNVKYQVSKNNQVVGNHLKMKMKGFVIPGGKDDQLSNGPYKKAAFDLGMETVQCEQFPGDLIVLDSNLYVNHLQLGRKFIHTSITNQSIIGDSVLFKEINTHLNKGDKFWINAFTHGVGNQDIWNISLVFPAFKTFFNKLAKRYGQKGKDDIWMAPTQEVYDYLRTCQSIKYTVTKSRKRLILEIDTNKIPPNLRYHEITFLLTSNQQIKNINGHHCMIKSYSKGEKKNLITINWQ